MRFPMRTYPSFCFTILFGLILAFGGYSSAEAQAKPWNPNDRGALPSSHKGKDRACQRARIRAAE